MTIITLLGGAAVVAAVPALLAKRHLQMRADTARAAWTTVQAALERRHDLALQIHSHSARPADPQLNALESVLKQAEFTSGLGMKLRVENQLTQALRDSLALGGDDQLAKAVAALPEAQVAIARAAGEYNARVRDYNAAVQRFAQAARFFAYEPRETFVLDRLTDQA